MAGDIVPLKMALGACIKHSVELEAPAEPEAARQEWSQLHTALQWVLDARDLVEVDHAKQHARKLLRSIRVDRLERQGR